MTDERTTAEILLEIETLIHDCAATDMPTPANKRPKPVTGPDACPSCSGAGKLDSLNTYCPACAGAGRRERTDAAPMKERRG